MSKKLQAALEAARKTQERAARLQAHETLVASLRDALSLARARDYRTAGETIASTRDLFNALTAGETPEKDGE